MSDIKVNNPTLPAGIPIFDGASSQMKRANWDWGRMASVWLRISIPFWSVMINRTLLTKTDGLTIAIPVVSSSVVPRLTLKAAVASKGAGDTSVCTKPVKL